jgi:predicted nucleic acid-binding protein
MKNLENKKIAIDTNILIYASQKNSPFYEFSRKLILEGINQELNLFIADKTLFEYYAVISNVLYKNNLNLAKKAYQFYLNCKNLNFLTNSLNTKNIVFELLKDKKAKGKYIHDLVLASIILENNLDVLVTNNSADFNFLKGIEVVKPLG